MANQTRSSEDIRSFWDKQAVTHGTDLQAVMPDTLLKDLEIKALTGALDPKLDTLEAGCGNGVNLFRLAPRFKGRLVGFDYSAPMIDAAKKASGEHRSSHVDFHVADILGDLSFLGKFPQIFTDRCLINLTSEDLQLKALDNLAALLAPGGRLALVECTQQGLSNINVMRAHVGLPVIENHWHNLYLDEDSFIAKIPSSFRHVETVAFSSLYYLMSRVFNAKLTPPGKAPDYMAEINKVATQLPSVGDFGPHKLFVLEKRA